MEEEDRRGAVRYYSAVKLERQGGRLFAKCSACPASAVVVAVIQGSEAAQDRSDTSAVIIQLQLQPPPPPSL